LGDFPKIFKEVERHMNKKVLSLVLALVIVLGSFGTVLAADPLSTQDQKIQWLIDNEVVVGRKVNADGSADLALEEYLTRAEVTKLIVYTLRLQNLADALKGVMQPFPDVALDHWANGYISVATTQRADVANGRRIVIGYPDGKFYPNNNVTYAELATMLVRIVKKDLTDAMEKNAIWATSYMRWAQEEGILRGLTVADSNKPVPRKDAFEMIYNAMYELGLQNYNAPKFGDVMGIVSKAQAGIVQLNQDPQMQYKITFNSRVTDGTTWRDVAENSVTPGSLVRIIANADGEIQYLVELGNPREGAKQAGQRWFDVADKTVSTKDFAAKSAVAGDAYFFDQYFNKIYVNGVEAVIDSSTRFFVADVTNNALKEIETLDEVFRYYIRDYKDLNYVYMGYDQFQGRSEAKVIVFGEVDKYMGGTAVRRVTNYYSTRFHIEAEDTKGARQTYNLAETSYFPRAGYVDKMDVIRLYLDGDKYTQSERGNTVAAGTTFQNKADGTIKNAGFAGYDILIDYSEDNVYEVTAVNLAERYIELRDEYKFNRRFYIKDADVFLEGQAKKGAHVQVVLGNNNADVEIVSVVDKALEGALPTGVRVGDDSGFVVAFAESKYNNVWEVTIADWNATHGWVNHRAYQVHGTDADINALKALYARYQALNGDYSKLKDDANYYEIVFDIRNKYDATPYIFNIEKKLGKGVLPGEGNLPRLNVCGMTGTAEGGELLSGEYNKAAIALPLGASQLDAEGYGALPRYSEVVLKAALKDNGAVLTGFKVAEGSVDVKLTVDLAKGQVSFQMPRTGNVRVCPVYEVVEAKIINTGNCYITIEAVNGVDIENIPVGPDEIVTTYDTDDEEDVPFVSGDKVTISGNCDDECELVGFEVKRLCGAGEVVQPGTVILPPKNVDPCGQGECNSVDCAVEIELACITEIKTIGREEASNAFLIDIKPIGNGEYEVTPKQVKPEYTVEDLKYDNGFITGKIVGKDGAVVIKHEVRESGSEDVVADSYEKEYESANINFKLNTCEQDCEKDTVRIIVTFEQDCNPCTNYAIGL
jgi:hypothetical protein